MSLERMLQHAKDKDGMHRLLDEMEEGTSAILLVRVKDKDSGNSSVDYAYCGNFSLWEAMGMLETSKQFIFSNEYHEDDEDEES